MKSIEEAGIKTSRKPTSPAVPKGITSATLAASPIMLNDEQAAMMEQFMRPAVVSAERFSEGGPGNEPDNFNAASANERAGSENIPANESGKVGRNEGVIAGDDVLYGSRGRDADSHS